MTDAAPAGQPTPALNPAPATCVEIMTGAPLPAGADLIVPVEETSSLAPGLILVSPAAELVSGRHIHRTGSDAKAGETVLAPGIMLDSRCLGAAASCGAAWLTVSRLPRIAIFATGDELVAADENPLPHQIRQSNAHSIRAALQRAGYPVATTGTPPDDPEATGNSGDFIGLLRSDGFLTLPPATEPADTFPFTPWL